MPSNVEYALMAGRAYYDTAGGSLELILNRNNATVAGGRGDDHLHVSGTGNTIAGGKGNDLIEVGGTDNVVDYRMGDGTDTLRSLAASGTVLRFGAGIAPSDLRLRLDDGDLVIGIGESQSLRYGDNDGCDDDGQPSCICADLKKRRQPLLQRPIHFH